MKTFITSVLLLLTIGLFAQPQKGDLYVGFSNFQISRNSVNISGFTSSSQSSVSLSPTFGKFIADNTLIGGGFSFSNSFFSPQFPTNSTNLFGLNLLVAQYFGKGKLKGLSQLSFNSNLTSAERSNIRRRLTGSLGLGGAYFVNDFTAVQLLYNINIFQAVESQDTRYFTSDFKPNIGLGLRTFLLRNREGVENLSAINSIKKGTTLLGLAGNYQDNGFTRSHSISGRFDYFFLDGLYGGIGLSNFLLKNKDMEDVVFKNFDLSLNAGYYLRFSDRLYINISTSISNNNRTSNAFVSNDDRILFRQNAIRSNNELGLAFFLGRHKLEPGIGFRFSSTRIKEVSLERTADFSPNIYVRHEWFLAQNFAFTANANYRINDVFYSVSFNPFIDPENLVLFEFAQNRFNLGVGFKWYLSTPVE